MDVIQITDRLVIPMQDAPINVSRLSWYQIFSAKWEIATQRLQESGVNLDAIKITKKG